MINSHNNQRRVQDVDTLAQFNALKPVWDDLCSRATECIPMLTHGWLTSWWEAFGTEYECHILLVWQGEELIGGAPLVIKCEKIFLLKRRVMTLFANPWVDRMTMLMSPHAAHIPELIFEHLGSSRLGFDILDLFPLENASPTTSAIVELAKRNGWHYGIEDHLQSPYLQISAKLDDLLSNLSSSYRQTVRRRMRKIESLGTAKMRIVRDASCLDAIMEISLESWQHDEGTSMASTQRLRDFYSSVITNAAKDETLRCALMEIDGEPAAFEFNIFHRHTVHNFKLGYKKKFSDLSPGIALKLFTLQELINRRDVEPILEYDFMGAAEPYKLNWTKQTRPHIHVYIFSPRWDTNLEHGIIFVMKPWILATFPRLAAVAKSVKNRCRGIRKVWPY